MDLAQGEYIAIFDHDDISLPTRLEKQVEILDKNPEIGAVSALLQFFQCKQEGKIKKCPEYDHEIRSALTNDCYFQHTAAMLRKSVLDTNNIRYESFFSPCEDYQLWNRLLDITRFYCIQEVLVRYRAFDGNTSHTQTERMKRHREAISLDIQNRYPAHHRFYLKFSETPGTRLRIELWGIPLLKIKNNVVYLFGFIRLFKIKYK